MFEVNYGVVEITNRISTFLADFNVAQELKSHFMFILTKEQNEPPYT